MRRSLFLFFFLLLSLSSAQFTRADNAGVATSPLAIGIFYSSPDGKSLRVGVGTTKPLTTLDVSLGELKLGSSGAACTAKIAGTLRFAETRLQLCDGTSWRNVSLDRAQ